MSNNNNKTITDLMMHHTPTTRVIRLGKLPVEDDEVEFVGTRPAFNGNVIFPQSGQQEKNKIYTMHLSCFPNL